jgi:hypothetical protein
MSVGTPNTRQHSVRLDQATSSVLYIGESSFGASESDNCWRIRKFETVGSVSTITYADGNDHYDNVWTNRAALSYS